MPTFVEEYFFKHWEDSDLPKGWRVANQVDNVVTIVDDKGNSIRGILLAVEKGKKG